MVAARSKAVAFVVALGGPSERGDKVLISQNEMIGRADGEDKQVLTRISEVSRRFNEYVRKGEDKEALANRLREMLKEVPERFQRKVEGNMEVPTSLWYRFFIDYDPALALAKVRCPLLFFIGEKDLQVPAVANLRVAKTAKQKGGNPDFTVKSLPDINHALQKCRTGSPSEYGQITETISPVVLNLVGDWIVQHTQKTPYKTKGKR